MGSLSDTLESESRLLAYVEALTRSLGHADRATPFRSYCTGLLLPGARKSVEPMAARVEPGRVRAAHQSLHHFVAKSDWSDDAVLAAARAYVLPIIEQRGPVRGWMIDDTAFPELTEPYHPSGHFSGRDPGIHGVPAHRAGRGSTVTASHA